MFKILQTLCATDRYALMSTRQHEYVCFSKLINAVWRRTSWHCEISCLMDWFRLINSRGFNEEFNTIHACDGHAILYIPSEYNRYWWLSSNYTLTHTYAHAHHAAIGFRIWQLHWTHAGLKETWNYMNIFSPPLCIAVVGWSRHSFSFDRYGTKANVTRNWHIWDCVRHKEIRGDGVVTPFVSNLSAR